MSAYGNKKEYFDKRNEIDLGYRKIAESYAKLNKFTLTEQDGIIYKDNVEYINSNVIEINSPVLRNKNNLWFQTWTKLRQNDTTEFDFYKGL